MTIWLDLSEAQRATLRKILSDGDCRARAIIDRVRPELEAKRAEIEAAMAAALTEEQRARYRDLGAHQPKGSPGLT